MDIFVHRVCYPLLGRRLSSLPLPRFERVAIWVKGEKVVGSGYDQHQSCGAEKSGNNLIEHSAWLHLNGTREEIMSLYAED